MSTLDLSLWLLTFAGLALGSWSIYWAHTGPSSLRANCGRWLFLLTLVELGGTAFVAALSHSISLAPMGIVSVFLVVAMLWESPAAQWQSDVG